MTRRTTRTACCHEIGCRRKQPYRLALGTFSEAVFLVSTSKLVKDHGDGTATFCMGQRHNITDAMRCFISENPEWVRAVLSEMEAGFAPKGSYE